MRQIRWGLYSPFGPQWRLGFPSPRRFWYLGIPCWLHCDCTVAMYDHEGD